MKKEIVLAMLVIMVAPDVAMSDPPTDLSLRAGHYDYGYNYLQARKMTCVARRGCGDVEKERLLRHRRRTSPMGHKPAHLPIEWRNWPKTCPRRRKIYSFKEL